MATGSLTWLSVRSTDRHDVHKDYKRTAVDLAIPLQETNSTEILAYGK